AAAAMVDAGASADTEVVAATQGSTTDQRSVQATLGTLGKVLESQDAEIWTGTIVAVTGPGVALRDRTSWFETKPLFGWRVLVPRTQQQSGPMVERLGTYGAVAEVVPTISVEPPRTPHQMEKAVRGLVTGRYEWIGFTSVNAVKAIREKFKEYGLDARAFAGLKVAAVGGVTADALRAWGIEPDLVPVGEQSAKGLLAEWPPYDEVLDPINRVFLPRADIATDTLVAGLQENGWEVDDVTAYRTVRAAPPPAPIRDAIKNGSFDAVVFTSSSTVRNLVGIAGKPHATTVVACIGPATAKTAEEHGLRVDVLAPEPSAAAVVDALAEFGAGMAAAAAEAGEPLLRPSEKRPAARRRAR
ncbi:MAG TPA: uroporphyrinogen-III synthase, partial [Actinomycetales bacterium]|nr:uroporphyrinogen-III synthase [Actinomycetales bacterium]